MVPRGRRRPTDTRQQDAQTQSPLHLYRGRAYRTIRDIYEEDHAEPMRAGQFRWLISTCIAAGVGALSIFVLVAASIDPQEDTPGFINAVQRMSEGLEPLQSVPKPRRAEGLAWSVAKSDRLVLETGAVSTRFIVKDRLMKRREDRNYTIAKPYARVVSRLTAATAESTDAIPRFNPLKLYALDEAIVSGTSATSGTRNKDGVLVRVTDLLGGLLPAEDGYELGGQEAADLVKSAQTEALEVLRLETAATEGDPGEILTIDRGRTSPGEILPAHTTELAKSATDIDGIATDEDRSEVRVAQANPGETLTDLLVRFGVDDADAKSMASAASHLLPDQALPVDNDIRLKLAPSVTNPDRLEPLQVTIPLPASGRTVGQTLLIARQGSEDFSARLLNKREAQSLQQTQDGDTAQISSLYTSVYQAGLLQRLAPESILLIMRIHAYETDFSARTRPGDAVEFLFDLPEGGALDGPPGELLFTSITTTGETKRYYRFRAADGVTDYYDDNGNNSKKFLTRQPIRGSSVFFSSGFGNRMHPKLNVWRMHQGVDWSAPTGTPILAAGNGMIEEAGRKGTFGNYIRIRHANGYATAYAHMDRFAKGVTVGVKVRQGQLIGYVGNTGISSGPHLHFEIRVNGRPVDPNLIKVPQERQLKGAELSEFQKERAFIDDLLRRSPVARITK